MPERVVYHPEIGFRSVPLKVRWGARAALKAAGYFGTWREKFWLRVRCPCDRREILSVRLRHEEHIDLFHPQHMVRLIVAHVQREMRKHEEASRG